MPEHRSDEQKPKVSAMATAGCVSREIARSVPVPVNWLGPPHPKLPAESRTPPNRSGSDPRRAHSGCDRPTPRPGMGTVSYQRGPLE